MKRKAISFILSTIFLLNIVAPISANASYVNVNEVQSSEKSNFNFIKTSDISDIEYTYQENEKTYLVKESTNSDLTIINTEIYEIKDETNILIEKFTTKIVEDNDVITITKYDKDENIVSSQYVDIKSGSLDFNNIQSNIQPRSSSTYTGIIQYDHVYQKYYTQWFDTGIETNGNTIIQHYTLSAIMLIIGGITKNPYISTGAGFAQFIIDEAVPIVYWTKTYKELWEITYPGRQFIGWAVGRVTDTTFYMDSTRLYPIGTDSWEYHDSIYWPSHMGFDYY